MVSLVSWNHPAELRDISFVFVFVFGLISLHVGSQFPNQGPQPGIKPVPYGGLPSMGLHRVGHD